MRIDVDQEICIGSASCVVIAAKTFGLNQEGKVFILNEEKIAASIGSMKDVVRSPQTIEMDAKELIIEAARSCPVQATRLTEDDGTDIVL